MKDRSRNYTAADLHGSDGRPHARDIRQHDIFNCYFVAPLGALGERQPARISDAIRFNHDTGDFTSRFIAIARPTHRSVASVSRPSKSTDPGRDTMAVERVEAPLRP